MSEPTLIADLEAAAAWADDPDCHTYNPSFAARLRAAAARLREALAGEDMGCCYATLLAINGGSPVSPGSRYTPEQIATAEAEGKRLRALLVEPASPPTTQTWTEPPCSLCGDEGRVDTRQLMIAPVTKYISADSDGRVPCPAPHCRARKANP